MKPKNGIKIRFQRAAANTNPQMDKVVLEDVLTAYKKTLGRKLISPQLKIWRIIKKSRITKLAVAAVIITAALIGAYHQLAEGRFKDISTSRKLGRNTSARPYGHNADAKREVRMGLPSIAQNIARSSVIVRARFLEKTDTGRHQGGLTESKWKMDVIKVIYGKISGQTIEVMGWQDPEFQEEGREVIMCLRMIEGQIYRRGGTYYDAPPERSLDTLEKKFQEVIESGAHLSASPIGDKLGIDAKAGYGEVVEDAKTSQARAVEPRAKSDGKQDGALQKFIRQYSKQKIVCLDIGEQYTFRSHNGIEKLIRLASVKDYRDTVIRKVRRAEVVVVVNGKTVRLVCQPYTMPTVIDGLRIQADTTSGWRNITKRVQLSIWDANDPIVDTRKFCFPIKRYLLFSHGMQAYNEVKHLGLRDGDPKGHTGYHDYGIDVAGYEGREEIVSPVDGRIIEIWPSRDKVSSVVVGNDDGLLFSLSHLDSILPSLQEGTRVEKGGKIGMLGKKGASGNFSHLHLGPWLSISALKEKKRSHNLNLYPWLVTTYQAQYGRHLYAIARPHHTVLTGEEVIFDGSKSLAYDAKIVDYRWEFDNGQVVRAVKAEKVFDKPGVYVGTLRVRDEQGNEDVDFCRVKVFTRDAPEDNIATIYMTHTPTLGISEGQEVLFRFWIQGSRKERISIDFGDGATLSDYVSYQEVRHNFDRQGIYIITATANVNGRPIMGKQRVVVESTAGR